MLGAECARRQNEPHRRALFYAAKRWSKADRGNARPDAAGLALLCMPQNFRADIGASMTPPWMPT
jgi:hypothetical protein